MTILVGAGAWTTVSLINDATPDSSGQTQYDAYRQLIQDNCGVEKTSAMDMIDNDYLSDTAHLKTGDNNFNITPDAGFYGDTTFSAIKDGVYTLSLTKDGKPVKTVCHFDINQVSRGFSG